MCDETSQELARKQLEKRTKPAKYLSNDQKKQNGLRLGTTRKRKLKY